MRRPRLGPRLGPAAGAVALALLAACADDGSDRVAPTPSTSVAPDAGGPTSAAGPDEAAAPCPEEPAVTGELADPARAADVDGDGLADEVSVHVVDERTIAVQVEYAAGGRTVERYDDDSVATFGPLRVARVADVDGDGDDDLWVVVGAGATVEVVTLVLGDGCGLVRPLVDGQANRFAVGASVGFLSGIECVDIDGDGQVDGFHEHTAERAGGSTYRGSTTEWVVETEPAGLARGDTEPLVVDIDTDDARRYGELTCG